MRPFLLILQPVIVCLLLKILLKALFLFEKKTWTSNTFVFYWFYHGMWTREREDENKREERREDTEERTGWREEGAWKRARRRE